jgi:hypothetical protein
MIVLHGAVNALGFVGAGLLGATFSPAARAA